MPRPPRVLYLQYTSPGAYPPLENSARMLAEHGWDVRLLGARRAGLERLVVRPHENLDMRLMSAIPRGVRHRVHYLAYCAWAAGHTLWWRPDWVYASDFFGAPPGLFATHLPRTRVLYHEHDAPGPGSRSLLTKACLAARRSLLRRCDAVVVPGPGRESAFAGTAGAARPVMEVWNCPRKGDIPASRQPPAPPLRVVYHGTLVPERLPVAVVDALATLDTDWRLVIAGYETVLNRGHLQRLVDRATRLGCRGNLELHGPLARSELFGLASTCHVGLALVPRRSADLNMANMPRASCKVFDYLASGAMVVVSDDAEWRRSYVEPGLGLACDPGSVDSLSAAFRWCARHPEEMSAMGRRGQDLVRSSWNYEEQFAPVERLLSATAPEGWAGARPQA